MPSRLMGCVSSSRSRSNFFLSSGCDGENVTTKGGNELTRFTVKHQGFLKKRQFTKTVRSVFTKVAAGFFFTWTISYVSQKKVPK